MKRIEQIFSQKKEHVLSVYFTAGFPMLDDTGRILKLLDEAGADVVEVGIPFSDPLADGPIIQQSSGKALENGMSLKLLFEQLESANIQSLQTSVLLMGYLNPVMQFGLEKFLAKSAECGVEGVILPDLPPEIYEVQYKGLFAQYGIKNILLVTPQTSEARIRYIDSLSEGFIYIVSTATTTGNKAADMESQHAYFDRLNMMRLKNPMMIGFGISNHRQFETACKHASGAIIGSAFIKHLSNKPDLENSIPQFIQSIKHDRTVTT